MEKNKKTVIVVNQTQVKMIREAVVGRMLDYYNLKNSAKVKDFDELARYIETYIEK